MYDVMSGHLKIASNLELGLYLPPSNFNLVFSNKQAKNNILYFEWFYHPPSDFEVSFSTTRNN